MNGLRRSAAHSKASTCPIGSAGDGTSTPGALSPRLTLRMRDHVSVRMRDRVLRLATLLAMAAVSLCVGASAAAAEGGEKIVALGNFLPLAVNASDQVVGHEGAFWSGGQLKQLAEPAGSSELRVTGLDDAGTAIGSACAAYSDPCTAVTWSNGGPPVVPFHAPHSPISTRSEAYERETEEVYPYAIDDAGDIAGQVSYGNNYTLQVEEFYKAEGFPPAVQAFYADDGAEPAQLLGETASKIIAISPARDLAEQSTLEYENSLTYVELGPHGAGPAAQTPFCVYGPSVPPSMASDGSYTANRLIGEYEGQPNCTEGLEQPMLHMPSGVTTVLPLGGASSAVATGVNASHDVVGTATVGASQHAVMWPEGEGPIDLNTLLPEGSGWQLSSAIAINNNGDVVGMGTFEGHYEAYLLHTSSGLTVTSVTLSPSHPTLETGPFTATITVRNESGSETITGIKPALVSSDPAGLTIGSPNPSSVGSLAPGATATFTYTLTPLKAETLTLQAKATGESESGTQLTSREVRRSVDLSPGHLSIALQAHPAIAELNQPDTVTATITNKTSEALTNIKPQLVSSPASGISIGAPSAASVASIEPHASITITWQVTGSVTGSYELEALVEATSAETGAETDAANLELPVGVAVVEGVVHDNEAKPAPDVKLSLTGKSDEGGAISMTTTSNGSGTYRFAVAPGTYAVTASGEMLGQNGGALSVAESPSTHRPVCPGAVEGASCKLLHLKIGESAAAAFTYTYCTASSRTPNGKPATGCPIVFIPGFLGSRIKCDTGELWFSPAIGSLGIDWADMDLEADGETDAATDSCSGTAGPVSGQAGVLTRAAGSDIYGSALEYLERIAPGRVYAYTYDWRRSPLDALPALDQQVDEILKETGAKRVVLMAHSMGGLVTQGYLADAGYAEKVERVVTIGTPYWGAPKSHIALAFGQTGGVELEGLDVLASGNQLQRAVRNYTGLYWLYPSDAYGPWLEIEGPGWPAKALGGTAIDPWIADLKGTTSLYNSAIEGHADLDGFKTNGVPYEIMVGIGEPTITGLRIGDNPFNAIEEVEATYGSGDQTVPARSQTQGAFGKGSPLGENVPIHYVCGVSHMSETASSEVQSRIENYLLDGEAIEAGAHDTPAACPYNGVVSKIYEKLPASKLAAQLSSTKSTRSGPAISVVSGGETLTLQAAVEQELVTMTEAGGVTTVVTSTRKPVVVQGSGKQLEMDVQKIGTAHNGPSQHYGPLSGTVHVATGGAVSRGGRLVRATALGPRPRTTAAVSRCYGRYRVRLTARPAAATFYRISNHTTRYKKPLSLTKAQLKRLTFSSISKSGIWGAAKKLPVHLHAGACAR